MSEHTKFYNYDEIVITIVPSSLPEKISLFVAVGSLATIQTEINFQSSFTLWWYLYKKLQDNSTCKCMYVRVQSIVPVTIFLGPPSVNVFCDVSGDVSGAVNVTVSWTLSGRDSADFYLINITTNAPETPIGRLLNITTASVTLTGFMADYKYSITVRGVNCESQEGRESRPLRITPQCKYTAGHYTSKMIHHCGASLSEQ